PTSIEVERQGSACNQATEPDRNCGDYRHPRGKIFQPPKLSINGRGGRKYGKEVLKQGKRQPGHYDFVADSKSPSVWRKCAFAQGAVREKTAQKPRQSARVRGLR